MERNTLDLLYKLTVRRVIDYGLVIYFHKLKQTQKAKLYQVQYRAAKLCTGALKFTSQAKLEKELAWESISERADFVGLCIFHKIHLGLTRALVTKCMPKYNVILHNTRYKTTYVQPKCKGTKFHQSFFPYFTRKWDN